MQLPLTLFDDHTTTITEIKQLPRSEHYQAELERIRAGYDGCGCQECQQIYKTLDLSKYGSRVIEAAGIIAITAGKAGADKWEQYNKPDYWKGNVFITGGKGYRVTPGGFTECLGPEAEAIKEAKEIIDYGEYKGITKKRSTGNKRGGFNRGTKYNGRNARKAPAGKRLPLRARNN